jgi:hypothetical protein
VYDAIFREANLHKFLEYDSNGDAFQAAAPKCDLVFRLLPAQAFINIFFKPHLKKKDLA